MKRKFTTTIDEEKIDSLKIKAIQMKVDVNTILEILIDKFLKDDIQIDINSKK